MKLPLMIDTHFHARDLGQKHKGTFVTETKAALAGGVGTVIAMPNTDPPLIRYLDVLNARRLARKVIYCDLGFHFGTDGANTSEFSIVPRLVKGLKVYLNPTTGDLMIEDVGLIDTLLWLWPGTVLFHAEGAELLQTVLRLGQWKNEDKKIHICHVSLAEEVEIIRKAKREFHFQNLTAEACLHHLAFTEDDRSWLGPYGIMKPPLATEKDREALWGGVRDGTIDIIATDHAPHSQEEKESKPPPFGVTAEPTFPVAWMLLSERGFLLKDLVRLMHDKPAEIFGIKPDPRSHMLVDLDAKFKFTRDMVQSRAGRSPYEGMTVKGRITQAYLHGKQVISNGEILVDVRAGKVI